MRKAEKFMLPDGNPTKVYQNLSFPWGHLCHVITLTSVCIRLRTQKTRVFFKVLLKTNGIVLHSILQKVYRKSELLIWSSFFIMLYCRDYLKYFYQGP